jgi:hypothetical protein
MNGIQQLSRKEQQHLRATLLMCKPRCGIAVLHCVATASITNSSIFGLCVHAREIIFEKEFAGAV